MPRKSYNRAKVTCKICNIFGRYPDILESLDCDLVVGMNYLEFVRKYNKIIEGMGVRARLVSSNYYSHRGHVRPLSSKKLLASKKLNGEELNESCSTMLENFVLDNVFLKTTFTERLWLLNDLQQVNDRRRLKRIRLEGVLWNLEEKLDGMEIGSGDYNKTMIRKNTVTKELESLEDSLTKFVRDTNDLFIQIEDTYKNRSEKFSETDFEKELRKRLGSFFFNLNDNINGFMTNFRMYLEYDELKNEMEKSNNIMKNASRMLMETINTGISGAIRTLPQGTNISQIPGVKAIEETLKPLVMENQSNAKSD